MMRGILAWLLSVAVLVPIMPALASDHVVILTYHHIGERSVPATNVRVQQFMAHVRELEAGGHTIMPLQQVVNAMQSGVPLPDKAVAITVDNPYNSFYRLAWPELRKRDWSWTLFVATDKVDRGDRGFLDWSAIRELQRAGVTIASQGAAHRHLALLAPDEAAADIAKASERFRAELGIAPRLFAYPYGEASRVLQQAVKALGFAAAFGHHSGVAHRATDRFYLPRFSLTERYAGIDRFRTVVRTQPLPIKELTPLDMALRDDTNPPAFGFTVTEPVANLRKLSCFSSSQGKLKVELLGETRVEVRHARALSHGRERINCTLAGGRGQWRWLGYQFLVGDPP